jgi:hypothetical protein
MAGSVKLASLPKARRCTCEEMLRRQWLHKQKAGLSRPADIGSAEMLHSIANVRFGGSCTAASQSPVNVR